MEDINVIFFKVIINQLYTVGGMGKVSSLAVSKPNGSSLTDKGMFAKLLKLCAVFLSAVQITACHTIFSADNKLYDQVSSIDELVKILSL